MSTAAAYLRRSVSKDPTKEVSREAQDAACRRMAKDSPLALYVDWGISGGTARRPEYQRLRADVEAGSVSAVYAYSVSRLGRNARELLDFLEACKTRGVIVTTEAEGTIGGKGAFADFMLLIMAGLAQLERELASERTLAAHAVRRERGDHIGPAPYGLRLDARRYDADGKPVARGLVPDPSEDFEAVVAAYRETRSLQGTTRLLNERQIPTKSGRPWRESSVRGMLRRRAPELLPTVKGARPSARAYLLTGLLRCPHDGSGLLGKANGGRWVSYGCPIARDVVGHPYPRNVSEAALLPWIVEEVGHIDLGGDRAASEERDLEDRAALAARLDRAHDLYISGAITRERHDREAADVAAAFDKLGSRTVVSDLGDLDELWTWAPADTNRVLRAILERVELGPDMRPVSAVWRNPALRRP